MGYRVEAGVYSAEEVGASQERERLFILALANTCGAKWRSWIAEVLANTGQPTIQWRKKGADSFAQCSEDVGHAISEVNRGISGQLFKTEGRIQQSKEGWNGNVSRGGTGYTSFPMGQGYEQYEWEHLREVEPSLGCTIDGYNFREDLLRALGNSVVEQTAELAFIDLLNKHLKNV
jgi:DNA (cytosine-5)-methyltransferase 1